jgi:hypothetical protein
VAKRTLARERSKRSWSSQVWSWSKARRRRKRAAKKAASKRKFRKDPSKRTVASTRDHELSDADFTDVPSFSEKIRNLVLLKPDGTHRFMVSGSQECTLCGSLIKRDDVYKHMSEVHAVDMRAQDKARAEKPPTVPDPSKVKPKPPPKAKEKNAEWKAHVISMAERAKKEGGPAAARAQAGENMIAALQMWARSVPEDFDALRKDAAVMADVWYGMAAAMRIRIQLLVDRPPHGLGLAPSCVEPLENVAQELALVGNEHMEVVARVQRRYAHILEDPSYVDVAWLTGGSR